MIADSVDGTVVRGLVIRGFSGDGIQIDSGSTGNIIAGNWIGNFNSDGTTAAVTEQNTGNGVNVLGSNNVIGGTTLADRNVISGSGSNGVRIAGTGVNGNFVAGNYIGTDIAGTTAVANAGDGVRIESNATGNTVGGSSAAHRNIIAGNTLDGVRISGEGADDNIVRSNWIGLASDGVTVIGNISEGVESAGGADNAIIGGIGMGNFIVGSGQQGVFISGTTTGTVVQGNYIGTNATQTVSGGNAKNGIRISSGSTANNNTFGGVNPGEGNVIANNGTGGVDTAGIHLAGVGSNNSVIGNSIYNNVGLGIDLGNSGVTGNDNLDPDGGSNGQQNFPIITSAESNGSQITLSGSLNTTSSTSSVYVHFYATTTADGNDREGERYLGSIGPLTTDASGNVSFTNIMLSGMVAVGDYITATATVSNNTSEFSQAYAATAAPNVAPTITNLSGDNLSYSEGAGAVVNEQGGNALVADVDSTDFSTGTLTVSFVAGSDIAEDVLSIRNQGTGAGQIGVSGSNVTYDGFTIGTFTGGSGGTNLVITLNASADATAASALVNNITYQNTDTDSPTSGARTVRFVLTDGDGGNSGNHDTTVTVSGVNDAPVAVVDTATAVEAGGISNGTAGTNPTGNVLTNDTDVDAGDTKTVTGVLAGVEASAAGNVASSVTGSYGSINIAADGTYNYTVDNSNPTVQALSTTANTLTDVFTYTMRDTAGLTSTSQITVTVQGANDAPTITSSASASIYEANTAVSTIVGNDVDSGTTLAYSIVGGVDAARFSINSSTGAISFVTAPDFENPTDTGLNNVYDVIVQVSDGSLVTTQALAVTVLDVISTLTVTTTADNIDSGIVAGNAAHTIAWLNSNRGADGAISLREAIIAANNTAGLDTIDFDIAGSGVHTILINNMSLGALPRITDAVNIDGYSQTGAQVNTLAVGSDAVLQIELRGGLTTAEANGAWNVQSYFGGLMFDDGSSGSSVRGLIIGGFLGNEGSNRSGSGIIVRDSNTGSGVGVSNITIAGNWIGLDGTGAANGNQMRGVYVRDASNVTIGGPSAADRNVISGQSTIDARDTGFDGTGHKLFNGTGIQLTAGATNATIQNNYVGTNVQGTAALGNHNGIVVHSSSTAGALVTGNVVAGNVIGIYGRGAAGSTFRIVDNTIGLAADRTTAVGNSYGVWMEHPTGVTIGGTTNGTGNIISANNIGVVVVNNSVGEAPLVAIQGNSIYGNTSLGIDLATNSGGASIQTTPDGVTANDGAISASAPNLGMDKPILSQADLVGNTLTLSGYVGSAPGQSAFANARVEFFESSTSSGAGQGKVYLGFLTTDANGNFTGTLDVTGLGLTFSDSLTATATRDGVTSEFSSAFDVNVPPLANSDSYQAIEMQPIVIDLLANDTDVEADTLTITHINGIGLSVGQPLSIAAGTLVLNPQGTLTFTSAAHQLGAQTFTYTLSDGRSSVNALVTVVIDAANTPPTARGQQVRMLAGETIVFGQLDGLLTNVEDADNDNLAIQLVTAPTVGTLTVELDGSWSYVAAPGFFGNVAFSYVATDGVATSLPAEVSITVEVGVVSAAPPAFDLRLPADPTVDVDSPVKLIPEAINLELPEAANVVGNEEHIAGFAPAPAISPDRMDAQQGSSQRMPEETRSAAGDWENSWEYRPHHFTVPIVTMSHARIPMLHVNLSEATATVGELESWSVDSFQSVVEPMPVDAEVADSVVAYQLVAGSAVALFVGVSVGFAAWCASSTYLISLAAASMPIWSRYDIIFVVRNPGQAAETDDESLAETIVAASIEVPPDEAQQQAGSELIQN